MRHWSSARPSALSALRAGTALTLAGSLVVAALSGSASAAPRDGFDDLALDLAYSIAQDPNQVTGAHFENLPGNVFSYDVFTTPAAGFPTDGNSYALLSTGYAGTALEPNNSTGSGDNLGGGNVRGDSDYDVTILRMDVNVPAGSNCLVGMDFKFLSEEYPEYVGSPYNDAFIAELDKSTWTTHGSQIDAPDNFAFDAEGNPITINSTGVTGMSPEQAEGTTFDGATQTLTAATPISPGHHSLYFSIFDQGDHVLDSAVMLNRLRFGHVGDVARDCRRGATQAGDAQVLLVHGVTQDGNVPIFSSLQDKVKSAEPATHWEQFQYYQDKSGQNPDGTCDAASDTQTPPTLPADTLGMPIDTSQNGTAHCDSEGDVAQNAFRLEQKIRDMYEQSGQKVILVGYSMGGLTIRTFLAYSMSKGDGVAQNMVDSVVTLHGVQQGSALAGAGQAAREIPFGIGDKLAEEAAKALPDPTRPSNEEFDPNSALIRWMHAHSAVLPDIPFYNTWGDEQLRIHHCFLLFDNGCYDHTFQLGDVVLFPGTDSPTQDVNNGGHRFLPKGYTKASWQWREPFYAEWDPFSDSNADGVAAIWNAPMSHSNVPSHQESITVTDCQSGTAIQSDEEISRVIIARVEGTTYECDPSKAPS